MLITYLIIGYTEERSDVAKIVNPNFENCSYKGHEDGVWRLFQIRMKRKQNPGIDTESRSILDNISTGLTDSLELLSKIPGASELSQFGSVYDIILRTVTLIDRLDEVDWSSGMQGSLFAKSDTIENWKNEMRASGDWIDVGPLFEDIVKLSSDIASLFPSLAWIKMIIVGYDAIKGLANIIGSIKYVRCA